MLQSKNKNIFFQFRHEIRCCKVSTSLKLLHLPHENVIQKFVRSFLKFLFQDFYSKLDCELPGFNFQAFKAQNIEV